MSALCSGVPAGPRSAARSGSGNNITVTSPAAIELHSARPTELDASVLYRILKLRVDVFVVEQRCAYPELDGRDLEPTTTWCWATAGDQIIGTLRVLRSDPAAARIGRVATAPQARSAGVGRRLMELAIAQIGPDVDMVLDAQVHLQDWYGRFGFASCGKEYVEDRIPHIPMRRPAGWVSPTGSGQN